MTSDHDEDGISFDFSPAEAQTLALFMNGHVKDGQAVRDLKRILADYANRFPAYHAAIARTRASKTEGG